MNIHYTSDNLWIIKHFVYLVDPIPSTNPLFFCIFTLVSSKKLDCINVSFKFVRKSQQILSKTNFSLNSHDTNLKVIALLLANHSISCLLYTLHFARKQKFIVFGHQNVKMFAIRDYVRFVWKMKFLFFILGCCY